MAATAAATTDEAPEDDDDEAGLVLSEKISSLSKSTEHTLVL